MEEQGRDPGSVATFLAVQGVTRKISDFPSHLPAARERCDQMVFYYNRWEQKINTSWCISHRLKCCLNSRKDSCLLDPTKCWDGKMCYKSSHWLFALKLQRIPFILIASSFWKKAGERRRRATSTSSVPICTDLGGCRNPPAVPGQRAHREMPVHGSARPGDARPSILSLTRCISTTRK